MRSYRGTPHPSLGLSLCGLSVPGWHRLPMQGICLSTLSYVLQLGYQIVFLRSLLVPSFVLINLLEVRNQMGLFGNYPISVPSSPAKCPYLQNEGRNVEQGDILSRSRSKAAICPCLWRVCFAEQSQPHIISRILLVPLGNPCGSLFKRGENWL